MLLDKFQYLPGDAGVAANITTINFPVAQLFHLCILGWHDANGDLRRLAQVRAVERNRRNRPTSQPLARFLTQALEESIFHHIAHLATAIHTSGFLSTKLGSVHRGSNDRVPSIYSITRAFASTVLSPASNAAHRSAVVMYGENDLSPRKLTDDTAREQRHRCYEKADSTLTSKLGPVLTPARSLRSLNPAACFDRMLIRKKISNWVLNDHNGSRAAFPPIKARLSAYRCLLPRHNGKNLRRLTASAPRGQSLCLHAAAPSPRSHR
jgi:hypothetical protein